jgi:type VI secretion system protein ImpF
MVELTPQERLQPALLNRLKDDDPAQRNVEPREARLINKAQLREAVLRDLAWLFNCVRLSGDIDWASYPYARHSVINCGLPALSGRTASALDIADLESEVRQVILDFEPRIIAATLQVEALVSDLQLDHHNVVSVQIRGQMWAQPVPLEILLRTDVDLESGQVQIRDLTK